MYFTNKSKRVEQFQPNFVHTFFVVRRKILSGMEILFYIKTFQALEKTCLLGSDFSEDFSQEIVNSSINIHIELN